MPGSCGCGRHRIGRPRVAPGQQLGQVALAGLDLVLGLVGGGQASGRARRKLRPRKVESRASSARSVSTNDDTFQRTARLPR